jgi:hypothetical protein
MNILLGTSEAFLLAQVIDHLHPNLNHLDIYCDMEHDENYT